MHRRFHLRWKVIKNAFVSYFKIDPKYDDINNNNNKTKRYSRVFRLSDTHYSVNHIARCLQNTFISI